MPNAKAVFAAGLLTIGAALLAYSIFFSDSDQDVPGWEPVNKRIEKAITASPSEQPSASSQRPDTSPATTQATQPVNPAADSHMPFPASTLLDLNTARQSQLEDLPGIGASKAKAIIAFREQNGAFKSVKQLLEVKGIGPKMLEKIEPHVTVGSQTDR
ncbi:ComEA family DNA-binding protein [Cohnella kolymensis]|uniref:ComEA family DNA-binding protein n=1 Tax=Cohnella kolymensis TaxID=1590652 RepID=UPI0009E3E121|nr:helix-hairpin-helix domain-containing protein [Cohnella kolymensis]